MVDDDKKVQIANSNYFKDKKEINWIDCNDCVQTEINPIDYDDYTLTNVGALTLPRTLMLSDHDIPTLSKTDADTLMQPRILLSF